MGECLFFGYADYENQYKNHQTYRRGGGGVKCLVQYQWYRKIISYTQDSTDLKKQTDNWIRNGSTNQSTSKQILRTKNSL